MTLTKDTNPKDTNPKDAIGAWKWRHFTSIPLTVMNYLGVAMLEGAIKYRRHNYRISGVRASVYIDATLGHIAQYWEGEDIDEDSQNYHVIKAMASLAVLADAMIEDKLIDDRPPKAQLSKVRDQLQKMVDKLKEREAEALPPHTELGIYDDDPKVQKTWQDLSEDNPALVLRESARVIAEEAGLEVDEAGFLGAAYELEEPDAVMEFTSVRAKEQVAAIAEKPLWGQVRKVDAKPIDEGADKGFALERAVNRVKGKGGVTLAGMPEKEGD